MVLDDGKIHIKTVFERYICIFIAYEFKKYFFRSDDFMLNYTFYCLGKRFTLTS